MKLQFRKAEKSEISKIWAILQQAIARRKSDGSNQWQDGYPNITVVQKDIENKVGYVLVNANEIIGYCAILINQEPEYEKIKGKWLTNANFVVAHRLAISEKHLGKGFAKKTISFIENYALHNGIYSVKVDTNYDNIPMLKIFEKLGYTYCGEVYFRGSPRRAFEKVLLSN